MFGFLRRKKKEKYGPLVYLSEPTILYHTHTEKVILELLEEKLGSNNFIVPSDYGLKSTDHMIKDAEVFVAIAIVGKFTSLVVREIKIAQEQGKKIYTLDVARKGDEILYLFEEGIPERIEWLSPEETQSLYAAFRGEDFSGFMKFFFGDRKRQW
ncbi:hypothetical protein TON_1377 [Thermococcus onnurineus NA1]|uniref:Uncharacterized protein n=1 Tax=Thermococcus onnurineus (strain NA1) TaxID=523850 RepID=B6YXQ4_THEON|nr:MULTISPECIES: hypothetical protein [Thermococcus]ACJ16867.1 hypothetical protein TON_1377 [Thermococcus onnurineus NA1]NJE46801.1 hypothetical protein [Thermococcus sp. GR7]NJE77771.1 hypothetical protein [Thermococcus sp. GR4]NJF23405.1 hypothetical protein [Thermococcus sp. GR5]